MPPLPEFLDVHGQVGRVEVPRQVDVEQPGRSQGDVHVPGEVVIELEGIRQAGFPGGPGVQCAEVVIPFGHPEAESVRDDHLFDQADGDEQQPGVDRGPVCFLFRQLLELGHHLPVVDDGSGNELGEEGDEEQVVREVVFHFPVAVGVHQEGNLLEGEETDADGQDDVHGRAPSLG